MRLQIGPNIDNNRVRLDFRKSPDKPSNVPSYEIDRSKADEFVKKYNAQEKQLLNLTMVSVAAFAILGWVSSLRKRSLAWALIGIPGGIVAGLGVGAMISSHRKNNLMDKYDVKEYSKKS